VVNKKGKVSVPVTEPLGAYGASAVQALLQRFGQSVNKLGEQDVGNDLLVALREPGTAPNKKPNLPEVIYREVGLYLGVQVKTGSKTFFKHPKKMKGEPGWWFTGDDDIHFEFWTNSAMPFIVVLYNEKTRLAYWAHVSEGAWVRTKDGKGKGAKMFVPAANEIRGESITEFIKIVWSWRLKVTYEGTIWRSERFEVEQDDLLRSALLVPRLVAPHPNQGITTTVQTPAAALATILSGYAHYLHIDTEFSPIPTTHAMKLHKDWGWRFFAAFREWMETEARDGIIECLATAPSPAERAAAAVVCTCSYLISGEPTNALAAIKAVDKTDMSSTDQAWLGCHEARIMLELGSRLDARALARQWRALARQWIAALTKTPSDATLPPIVAALTAVSVQLDLLEDGADLVSVITSQDNVAAWWRAFSLESTLSRSVDFSFDVLTKYRPDDVGMNIDIANKLTAASLTSLYAGNYGDWRADSATIAKSYYSHIRRDPEEGEGMEWTLQTLRVAGHHDALKRVASDLWLTGPVDELVLAVQNASGAETTARNWRSTICLLAEAGDALDTKSARAWCTSILKELADDSRQLLEIGDGLSALYRLIPSLSDNKQRLVINHLLMFASKVDSYNEQHVVSLIGRFSPACIEKSIPKLDSWITAHRSSAIADALARRILEFSDVGLTSVLEQVAIGAFAVVGVLDSDRIPDDSVRTYIDFWVGELEKRVDAVLSPGGTSFGGPEASEILAIACHRRPAVADWTPLLELLENPEVPGFMKSRPLQLLEMSKAHLPDEVTSRIVRLLHAGMMCADFAYMPFTNSDALGGTVELAMHSFLDVQVDDLRTMILRLIRGSVQERQDAFELVCKTSLPESSVIIQMLCRDESPRLRVAAVVEMQARLLVEGSSAQVQALFERLSRERDGFKVSLQLAGRVARSLIHADAARLDALTAVLSRSRSSAVRRALEPVKK